MKAQVIVLQGVRGDSLYDIRIEINSVEDVLKMVTAGIKSASDDVTAEDIISDIDKEIITKTIEQGMYFCKTVQITKEAKLRVYISKN